MSESRPNGAAWRVKAQHPRRPGPLRITAKDGTLIAVSGQVCEGVSAEHLASMIRNGYVEPVEDALRPPVLANEASDDPAPAPRSRRRAASGGDD